jgi:predicted N-acetyltransferase YhbS
MALEAPVPLTDKHNTGAFDCGENSLNEWLKKRALTNQYSGASRTFVVCRAGQVIAFYALSSGAIFYAQSTGKVKRNMPDPIPVVILGRLGVDQTIKGKGIGSALVRDAILKIMVAAESLGIRAVVIHALNNRVKSFYESLGFIPSPTDPMILMATLNDLKASL